MHHLSRRTLSALATAASLALLVACGGEAEGEILEVVVGPERVECVGVAPMQCLVVDGEWFYEEIDGFEHQKGYVYRLKIEQYDAWPDTEEPPQDAGRYGYRLIEIITETPAAIPTQTPHQTSVSPSDTVAATPTSAPVATESPTAIPTHTPTPTLTPVPVPSQEEAEAAIIALPWVADGVTVDEQEAVLQLQQLARENRLALWNLVDKPWMQDDLSKSEEQAIILLTQIGGSDERSVQKIIGMPFFDTIEPEDTTILDTLSAVDGEGLRWLLAHPSLAGGITDSQRATVALLRLERRRPETAAAVNDLPWIRDGVDPSEENPALILLELALDSRQVFQALVTKEWMRDGLNSDEVAVLAGLWGISGTTFVKRDLAVALRIIEMPFLERVDGLDAAAVGSLQRLFWESDEVNYLGDVLSHPALRDGITNDQAMVVAALGIVVRDRPELLNTLLELGPEAVEKRVLQLPLRGEVTLSVLNVNPGTYATMDILEQMVRAQEEFMGVPFPQSYVGLLVADATGASAGGGPTGLITIDPGWEESDYIIAHEAAHTYWSFFPSWIAEGGAEFMTTVSAGTQFESHECSLADNLSGLDQLYSDLTESGQPTRIIRQSGCAYSLGRGLFLDLHETLGDEAFRQGFATLYLSMRDEEHFDVCEDQEKGLCYLRAAFITNAAPESAALAQPVIDHWYHGPGWVR